MIEKKIAKKIRWIVMKGDEIVHYDSMIKGVHRYFYPDEYVEYAYLYLQRKLRGKGDKGMTKYRGHKIYQLGPNHKNRGYDFRK